MTCEYTRQRLSRGALCYLDVGETVALRGGFDRWSNLFFDHLNISLRYNYVSGTVAAMLTTLPLFGQLAFCGWGQRRC